MRYRCALLSLFNVCVVWVCRLKYFCFRIAAWYFWLVMLNMWQSYWKADLSVCLQVNVQVHQCPSATASVFSPSVHLTAADTHMLTHTRIIPSSTWDICTFACWWQLWLMVQAAQKNKCLMRCSVKVLLEWVKKLISHSPTYQLPNHKLKAICETVVCISYHTYYCRLFSWPGVVWTHHHIWSTFSLYLFIVNTCIVSGFSLQLHLCASTNNE